MLSRVRYADNNLSPQRPSPSLSLSLSLWLSLALSVSVFQPPYVSPTLPFVPRSFRYSFMLLCVVYIFFNSLLKCLTPFIQEMLGEIFPLPRSCSISLPFKKNQSYAQSPLLSLPSLSLSHTLVLYSVTVVYLTLLASESGASRHL